MQCPKCGGSGYIDMYKHISLGACFECDGKGFVNRRGGELKLKVGDFQRGLPGLNKTQTYILYEATITNPRYCEFKTPDRNFEALLTAGYVIVSRTKKGWFRYTFCFDGELGIIRSDLDWSLLKEEAQGVFAPHPVTPEARAAAMLSYAGFIE